MNEALETNYIPSFPLVQTKWECALHGDVTDVTLHIAIGQTKKSWCMQCIVALLDGAIDPKLLTKTET